MKKIFMRISLVAFVLLLIWIMVAPGCMTFRKTDESMKKQFADKGVELKTFSEKIAGTNIHYVKTGNDTLPTIYFVHGTPGSWDAFADYLLDKDLLQHFRLVSIDRPGFGYSDFGKAFNLKRQSELISPIFYQLENNKPAFITGHSLGGPMIVKLVADNPGYFKGMVILAGSIDPAAEKPEKWRPWLFKSPLNWLVPGALRPSNEELWYLKKDLVDLRADFEKVTCQLFLLHGDKDMLVPFENVDYAKKMFTKVKSFNLTIFPNENHFIPWTRFKEIKQLLLNLDLGQGTMSNQ